MLSDMETERQQKREAKIELARRRYLDFVHVMFGSRLQRNWHQRTICQRLDKWLNTENDRLMIFLPPQTGKSTLSEIYLPPFIFATSPYANIIGASYAADLVLGHSSKARGIIDSESFRELFPLIRPGSTWRNNEWIIEYNTGTSFQPKWVESGGYRCAGLSGGTTGYPGTHISLGDAHKDRKEAESKGVQADAEDWYKSVIQTRVREGSRILLNMTRWCAGDLADRILKSEGRDTWDVLRLPSEYDSENPDVRDHRRIEGEALWPARFPKHFLEHQRKKVLGSYVYRGMHQQDPQKKGGSQIKLAWFEDKYVNYDEVSKLVWKRIRLQRGWDIAVSDDHDANSTVGLLAGVHDDILYICHMEKFQKDWPNGKKAMIIRAEMDGKKVRQGYESVGPQKGLAQDIALEVNRKGYSTSSYTPQGDKLTRALLWIPFMEDGRVAIIRASWNDDFQSSCVGFTGVGDEDDDEVDAMSIAYRMISELPNTGSFVIGSRQMKRQAEAAKKK